ncbi:Hypothetical predicted protein [Scomber scombrus]|uniref:Uncharacterized protein n=1 Tax=Scomber scombrus TaxID=13677 RepID=A0AAV1PMV2_SCOSC
MTVLFLVAFWFSKVGDVGRGREEGEEGGVRGERQVSASLLQLAIYLWLCSRPSCCWFKVRSLAENQAQGCEKHPHSHFTYRGRQKETECLWNKLKSQTPAQRRITFAEERPEVLLMLDEKRLYVLNEWIAKVNV